MLFTSNNGFLIYQMQQFLLFDLYNVDPKVFICFNCDDLNIFSAPAFIDFHRRIFWSEDRY